MKKLQEIDRLVEEAFVDLGIVTRTERQENALNKLARKCAEINQEDWVSIAEGKFIDVNTEYNSRLRDGQVEEMPEQKQEEVKGQTKNPSSKYYPLFQYLHDEFNIILLETDCQEIERLLNTQPREWWMDLKEGDKFVNKYGEAVEYVDTLLKSRKCFVFPVNSCTPYTDPTQSFRDKLTPELQAEFDKLIIK